MAKKQSPSKTTTSKTASKKPAQKTMPKTKSTPDKISQKKATKSPMDNLTILKNSPYLKHLLRAIKL